MNPEVFSALTNPYALTGFIVFVVLLFTFRRSATESPLRWAALFLAFLALCGGIFLGIQNSTVQFPGAVDITTGNQSPIVKDVQGPVIINQDASGK